MPRRRRRCSTRHLAGNGIRNKPFGIVASGVSRTRFGGVRLKADTTGPIVAAAAAGPAARTRSTCFGAETRRENRLRLAPGGPPLAHPLLFLP
jgi:hypothetical protein